MIQRAMHIPPTRMKAAKEWMQDVIRFYNGLTVRARLEDLDGPSTLLRQLHVTPKPAYVFKHDDSPPIAVPDGKGGFKDPEDVPTYTLGGY